MGENFAPLNKSAEQSHFPVFQWEGQYNIGIAEIDEQHRHLLDLINRLSAQLLKGGLTPEERQDYLSQVVAYSHYHFADEEHFMEEAGLDAGYVSSHKQIHRQFVHQLEMFMPELEHDADESTGVLLKFLFNWLVFHILGSDQAIHDQIVLINKGMSPSEAAAQATQAHNSDQVGPLLHALGNFFDLLSNRNRELRELNATLEQRVAERTQELQRANTTLVTLSQTDVLTGLPNRRHALQMLEILWSEAKASGRPMCCLMIDADYFKDVNDRHGHAAGDLVLQALALTLRNNVRTDDIVARLGGDEFCVLCPDTTLEGGMQLADLLLVEVAALHMKTWRSSISIGVACSLPGVEKSEDLIRLADEGLYVAKDSGRSCVRCLQEKAGNSAQIPSTGQ